MIDFYQNKGNNSIIEYNIEYLTLDFNGFNGTQSDLTISGYSKITRWIDSEKVLITTGERLSDQPGTSALIHTFEWNDTTNNLSNYGHYTSSGDGIWGAEMNDSYNYKLNGITYNRNFFLVRQDKAIELTTVGHKIRTSYAGLAPKNWKIFGANFDNPNITMEDLDTNNTWLELAEIELKDRTAVGVTINKNSTFTYGNSTTLLSSGNINSYFNIYNWTDTTNTFNTFLFMINSHLGHYHHGWGWRWSTLQIDEIGFRGTNKTILNSTGGDGSSSDLIYHSLSFEGGIGKSNYHISSITNADDNTGNGGSGNGGKGGSGTVIIKYIPKYNYKLTY